MTAKTENGLRVKGDKIYLTANAYIVETATDLPREFASELKSIDLNPSFMWVAGRFVRANEVNKNGHFWSVEDLESGQHTIQHIPMNINHTETAVGTFVEAKIVERESAASGGEMTPEIQALGVLWRANFPAAATMVQEAHHKKQLHFSMECVSEKLQCLECQQVTSYFAQAHEKCEHLAASAKAPRRFINPIFLGGALVVPPEVPAWSDADVTDVAAQRVGASKEEWESLMASVLMR